MGLNLRVIVAVLSSSKILKIFFGESGNLTPTFVKQVEILSFSRFSCFSVSLRISVKKKKKKKKDRKTIAV